MVDYIITSPLSILWHFGWLGFFLLVWLLTLFVLWLFLKKKVPLLGLVIISFFLSFVVIVIWSLLLYSRASGLRNDVNDTFEIKPQSIPKNLKQQDSDTTQPPKLDN